MKLKLGWNRRLYNRPFAAVFGATLDLMLIGGVCIIALSRADLAGGILIVVALLLLSWSLLSVRRSPR